MKLSFSNKRNKIQNYSEILFLFSAGNDAKKLALSHRQPLR